MVRNIKYIAWPLVALYLTGSAAYAEKKNESETKVLLSDSGNAVKGKRIFNSCLSCHAIEEDAAAHVGPYLSKIVGRTAGTLEGYRYSSALKSADFVWSEEKLDQWLKEPRTFLPGNRMTFMGLAKEQERKDLLAYLKQVTTSKE